MSLQYIDGDLLSIEKGIIVHQCNNKKVMNLGLAKLVRQKYPQHYTDYMNSPMFLGNVIVTKINAKFAIVGIIAQNGYGKDGRMYTRYFAFSRALNELKERLKGKNIPVYFPYKIGCNLAGGDWEKISGIIEKVFPDAIIVCKKE